MYKLGLSASSAKCLGLPFEVGGVRGQGAASTAMGLRGRRLAPKIQDQAEMPSRATTSLTPSA